MHLLIQLSAHCRLTHLRVPINALWLAGCLSVCLGERIARQPNQYQTNSLLSGLCAVFPLLAPVRLYSCDRLATPNHTLSPSTSSPPRRRIIISFWGYRPTKVIMSLNSDFFALHFTSVASPTEFQRSKLLQCQGQTNVLVVFLTLGQKFDCCHNWWVWIFRNIVKWNYLALLSKTLLYHPPNKW